MANPASASASASASARKRSHSRSPPPEPAAAEAKRNPHPPAAASPSPAGFIFMCNGATKPECYRHRVMGLPRGRRDAASRIRRGAAVFLYNFDAKYLYGPYEADSDGGSTSSPPPSTAASPRRLVGLARSRPLRASSTPMAHGVFGGQSAGNGVE